MMDFGRELNELLNNFDKAARAKGYFDNEGSGSAVTRTNASYEAAKRALAQALQALATAARAQGWKLIEEAPKDGTEIWAFNGEQGRMRWSEGGKGDESWALWVWADELLNDIDPNPDQPTHFTLLLSAPVVQEARRPREQ